MRTLIIAADPLARTGLAALLSLQPAVVVVGQAAIHDDLQPAIAAFQPEVVLWDLGWNPVQSFERLTNFVEHAPPVVALVTSDDAMSATWACGVRGVLRREADGTQIASALDAVAHGLTVSDRAMLIILPPAPKPNKTTGDETIHETLTERELEVLRRIAEGLPNKQIARELSISEHTVKFHVNAILGKMNAQSRTEAVVRATRAGLIFL